MKSNKNNTGNAKSRSDDQKPTQTDRLMEILKKVKCFRSKADECYGVLSTKFREVYVLKSKEFRDWLKKTYYKRHKNIPSNQAFQDTINILEHLAKSKVRRVFVRIGSKNKAIYIDKCDKEWKAIKITDNEQKEVSTPAVCFRRTKGSLPLRFKEIENSIETIERFANGINANKTDRRLIIAWLLSALKPTGPYPVLILQGEQGSGKSTIAKMLKLLIDPSIAPLRALPRSERDLVIYAQNSWVLAFDNVSKIPPFLSDALCRLSTGGGLSLRQMYTDADEVIFDATRPIILNGIGNIVSKSDLADRSLVVNMKRIKDKDRRPEDEIWKNFEKHKPSILAALAKGVSSALKNIDKIDLPQYPRMADSLKWIVAAESAIFKETGKFLGAYDKNRKNVGFICVESDPVATAIKYLMESRKSSWKGNATELLDSLEEQLPKEHEDRIRKEKSWPKAANALSGRLKEIAPPLRSLGINIILKRSGGQRTIIIKKSNTKNDQEI